MKGVCRNRNIFICIYEVKTIVNINIVHRHNVERRQIRTFSMKKNQS